MFCNTRAAPLVAAVVLVVLAVGNAQVSDPCHSAHTDEKSCDADSKTGGGCTWCKCQALPSACWTKENAAKLPSGVYSCDGSNSSSAPSHDLHRQHMIDFINGVPGNTWVAGHNERFKGMPVGSVARLAGVKPWPTVRHENVIDFQPTPGFKAPESFDSREAFPQCAKVIGDIRDQSNCGCCWAFAAAEAASDRLCIATNGSTQLPLSAEELCFCASDDGCDGGDLFTPWAFVQSSGLVTGGQVNSTGPFGDLGLCSNFKLPHCHHHGPQGKDPYPSEGTKGCPSQDSRSCPRACDDSSRAPHNNFKKDRYGFKGLVQTFNSEEMIQESIMKHGPVEAAFTVYSDFANYVSGVYKHVSGGVEGGHAVKIVGWGVDGGVKYWRIANSWNKYWGEDGYFRILRGSNECGIEGDVTASSGDSKWGPMN